mmetsp:Transcript_25420/g.52587  ORF Transcript_25420/g.52587 Transcript_25420/m.52587 type:complete len:249 (-) Transcript_25420:315-1061(-)
MYIATLPAHTHHHTQEATRLRSLGLPKLPLLVLVHFQVRLGRERQDQVGHDVDHDHVDEERDHQGKAALDAEDHHRRRKQAVDHLVAGFDADVARRGVHILARELDALELVDHQTLERVPHDRQVRYPTDPLRKRLQVNVKAAHQDHEHHNDWCQRDRRLGARRGRRYGESQANSAARDESKDDNKGEEGLRRRVEPDQKVHNRAEDERADQVERQFGDHLRQIVRRERVALGRALALDNHHLFAKCV